MTTVRLAFVRRRVDIIGVGCVLGLITAIVLSETGAAGVGTTLLIAAAVVAATVAGAPRTFWLRESETGLTVVRLLVPTHHTWSEIRGLAMHVDEEPETSAHRVQLRLRLVHPRGRSWGPFLGRLTLTDDDRPRGTEPRALAELFALFGRHGLPVDRPEFANAVLSAHGLPPLPPPPVRPVPVGPVPTPEEAYADAPALTEEQRHLDAHRSRSDEPPRHRRVHLLRLAALRDRLALGTADADAEQVAAALLAAGRLLEHDGVTAEDGAAREYVRQQYRLQDRLQDRPQDRRPFPDRRR
ncbi:hypothetical protein ACIRD3_05020 [Kitasatospora sp. NPDC093550]|uniref:hypothetical protein n=1 Tax=Kitasatospora sp. NPDC093550 TaxID=3364089 RepID=UPI00381631EC